MDHVVEDVHEMLGDIYACFTRNLEGRGVSFDVYPDTRKAQHATWFSRYTPRIRRRMRLFYCATVRASIPNGLRARMS
jgi:hypothetical protein